MSLMDDLAASQRLSEINGRYNMAVLRSTMPGLINQAAINEFKSIIEEYTRLLDTELLTDIRARDVRYKIADSHEKAAFMLSLLGKTDEASDAYEEAARLFEQIDRADRAAACRDEIRDLHVRVQGTFDAEFQRLQKAEQQTPPETLEHVSASLDLGDLCISAGDLFEARRHLEDALAELARIGYTQPPREDEVNAAFQERRREVSAGTFSEELPRYITLSQVQSLFRRLYTSLIAVYQNTDPEQAGNYAKLVREINSGGVEQVDPDQQMEALLEQVHTLEDQIRQRRNAADFFALPIGQGDTQNQAEEAASWFIPGEADNSELQKALEQARALSEIISRELAEPPAMVSLTPQRQPQQRKRRERIIDIFRLREELDTLGLDYENLRQFVYSPDQQLQQIESMLERVVRLEEQARQVKNPELHVTALLRRADLLLLAERGEEAMRVLRTARRRLGKVVVYSLGVHILSRIAEAQAHQQNWAVVSATCKQGIALVERYRYEVTPPYLQSAYLRSRIRLYSLGVRAASHLGKIGLMLERAELSKCRSVMGYTQQSAERSSEMEAQFQQACAAVSAARATGTPTADLVQQQRTLWDLLALERFKVRAGASFPPFTVRSVQAILEKDEAIIYYYWLDKQTLLKATLDRANCICELCTLTPEERNTLEAFAQTVLDLSRLSPTLERVSGFAEILLPQEGARLLQDKQRLIFSPHRLLHAIPFHALPWEGDFLIEHFAVSYIPNLSSLLWRYTPAAQQHILAVGTADFEIPALPGFNRLEGAEQEIDSLQQLYRERSIPVTTLTGSAATEASLQQLIATGVLETVSCLHFATHGQNVNANTPMESFLALRTSLLNGLEIANWRLNADLVVLSACSSGQRPISGRGMDELPGDELFGLQAAFFAAGARRILCSLWPVHDLTAPQLMKAFHASLSQGMLPELAMQAAIKEYLNTAEPRRRRVGFWAPFFLSVLGRPIS